MTPSNEERVIEQKLKELSALVEEREQVQTRIAKIEGAIRAFIELLEDENEQQKYLNKLQDVSKPQGITEAIRRILVEAQDWLTATEVRDRLAKDGFPLSGYANPLAVIYTTLTRLCDKGLATRNTDDGTFKSTESLLQYAIRGLAEPAKGTKLPRVSPPPKFSTKDFKK